MIKDIDGVKFAECLDAFVQAVTGKPLSAFAAPETLWCVKHIRCSDGEPPVWPEVWRTTTCYHVSNPVAMTRAEADKFMGTYDDEKNRYKVLPYPPPEKPAEVKYAVQDKDGALWHLDRSVTPGSPCEPLCDSYRKADMTIEEARGLMPRLITRYVPYTVVGFDPDGHRISKPKPVEVKFAVRCSCGCGQYFKDDGTHIANAERLEDAATFRTYSEAVIFHDRIRGTSIDEIVGIDRDGKEVPCDE